MEIAVIFVVLLAVVAVVGAPLRRRIGDPELAPKAGAELEAEREAKYAEIRDADLDHRTGKLSDEDHAALDHTLRREALSILDAIEQQDAVKARSRSG